MKNFIISIYCTFLFSIFSVQAAIPNGGSENKKVNAKCHVSLIDGSEAIIFYRIQSEKFPNLAKKIVGKRVLTQKSIEKIKIYRANECVLNEDNFTSTNSQSLDKKTER